MANTIRRRSRFRPCIDLHGGQVKQIVGGTLSDDAPERLQTNFVARLVKVALLREVVGNNPIASLLGNSPSCTETTHSRGVMSLN